MRQHGTKWVTAWIVAVLLAALGGWFWWRSGSPGVSERELATQLLAEYLRDHFKPKSVLIISNPFTQSGGSPAHVYAFEKAAIAGLERGLGKAVQLKVAFPALKPEVRANPSSVPIDPGTTTPLSFLVTEEAFDRSITENPGSDFVVSLIGLPVRLGGMQTWSKGGSPRFALLLPDWRIIGDEEAIQGAFKSGKLVAALVVNPKAPESSKDGTVTAVKDKYMLISSNNVSATLALSPEVFGLR